MLAPLYPQDDWDGAETRLRGFLEQYWGGPTTYSQERGHPRLRMRHAPFAIGPAERDAWLAHMRDAVDSLGADAGAGRDPLGLPGDGGPQHAEPHSRRRQRPLPRLIPRGFPHATTPLRSPVQPDPSTPALPADADWWRDAVIYQIYIRSFADGTATASATSPASGAGCRTWPTSASTASGSRRSIPRRWPTTGTTSPTPATWSPCSGTSRRSTRCSPMPTRLGLRVTVDLVPNHTSDQHEWFRAALAVAAGLARAGALPLPRRPRARTASEPPNNWPSVFGGPAWTRVPDGQWYLHLFAPEQPDLDFTNPEVLADLETTMRFWLDRGVDGFRIDVAHGMAKPAACRTWCRWTTPACSPTTAPGTTASTRTACTRCTAGSGRCSTTTPAGWPSARSGCPTTRGWRSTCGEDELQLAFNFKLLTADWAPDALRDAVTHSLAAVAETPAPACWVLSNHDRPRHVTRYGGGSLGLRRARAAALLQLALPGAAYLYNGDELGLPDVDLPDEVLQDPVWERSGRTVRGRDACRVPVPWSGTEPPYGFSTRRDTWLPMPEGWAGADRGGAGGRPVVDAVAVPIGAGAAAVVAGLLRGPGVAAGARGVPRLPPRRRPRVPGEPLRRRRCRCPRAGCCWPAPTWPTARCPTTRRCGCEA